MSNDHASRAVKMFSGILKYTGETQEAITDIQRTEIAQKLLHQGLKRPELKDELYMQLLKQTRCNPNIPIKVKAWELFQLVASAMPPSKVTHSPAVARGPAAIPDFLFCAPCKLFCCCCPARHKHRTLWGWCLSTCTAWRTTTPKQHRSEPWHPGPGTASKGLQRQDPGGR